MSRRSPLFAALVLSLPAAALLVGCSAKPENSPVIRKKFAEVDAMTKELQETRNLLRGISGDLTVMQDQLSNLRALSPDSEGAIQVLKKLEDIEARMNRIETEGAMFASASLGSGSTSSTTTAAPSTTTSTPAPKPAETTVASAPAPKPAETTAPKPAASTPRPSTSTPSTPAPRPAASTASTPRPATTTVAARPSAPRGTYHVIEAGETLEQVAQKAGISVDQLRSANGLPAGARPLKGQRLFVPAAR